MNIVTLLLLAVGLAMDAFAVSVSNSMCYPRMPARRLLGNSLSFGLFQGAMPVLGFFIGRVLGGVIRAVDHWLALLLLGFIGGKMVVEGIGALRRAGEHRECPDFSLRTMLLQSLATSIDALAVGISFAALAVNIWLASSTIALITFVCCLAGALLGKKAGVLLGDWAQIFGGLLLVGIGVKIFVEHLATGT